MVNERGLRFEHKAANVVFEDEQDIHASKSGHSHPLIGGLWGASRRSSDGEVGEKDTRRWQCSLPSPLACETC